jgi:hypothetical protein
VPKNHNKFCKEIMCSKNRKIVPKFNRTAEFFQGSEGIVSKLKEKFAWKNSFDTNPSIWVPDFALRIPLD